MAGIKLRAPSTRSAESLDDGGFNEEDEAAIHEYRTQRDRGNAIKIFRPKPLGWFSVIFVIANRMIGSGIFRTPDTVIQETRSILAAMLFWGIGAVVTFAGAMVFVEFGLTTPRLLVDGVGQFVPSNGGEKNYLEYVYHRPRRLATCIYGFAFIFLGNMASNAILFAVSIYIAVTGRDPSNAAARGIAIGAATFACLLHIYSRKLGIWLNNGFGSIKLMMLLALIIVAVVSFAGGLGSDTIRDAKENYADHTSFVDPPSGAYGYASSFLAIIFAYGGFNQANYVLGNIRQPRHRFKWEVFSAVAIISVLYICLNLCYYGIVPYDQLIDPQSSVAVSFFARTLSSAHARQGMAGIQAFSSLGNIIIQTFTAARVKQEIAKEGVLPWSRFFAENRSLSWKFWRHRVAREADGEATPVGALLLHWVFSMILILSSFSLSPLNSYSLYVNLYSFTIDAFVGFLVGSGLLALRVADFFKSQPGSKWSDVSHENKWLSTVAAAIYTIANLYPLVAVWFQPPKGQPQAGKSTIPLWISGTVGCATLACGLVYWFGFEYIYPAVAQEDLVVEKRHFLHKEDGELVVTNEIVAIGWESR